MSDGTIQQHVTLVCLMLPVAVAMNEWTETFTGKIFRTEYTTVADSKQL